MPAPETTSAGQDLRALVGVAWGLDRSRVTTSLALLLVNGLTSGLSLALLLPIVHSVTGAPGGASLGPVPLPDGLLPLVGLFVLLTAVQALATRASTLSASALQLRIVDALRQRAFEAVLSARWSFVLSRRRSDLIEIVTSGAMRSGMAFQQLMSLATTSVIVVAAAIIALVVSPVLALPALLAVGVMGAALVHTAFGPAHQLGREFGVRNRMLQAAMVNSLDSLRLVRTHDAAAPWNAELASSFGGAREAQLAVVRRTATISAISSIGLPVSAAALLLLARGFDLPPASIAVILLLMARIAGQVRQLAITSAQLVGALPAVGDLQDLIRSASEEVEVPLDSHRDREPAEDDQRPLVELRGVTYLYPGTDNGVRDLDVVVPRGQITALAGPSGAGKSTTVDLVLGLLLPQAGQVVVDGAPLQAEDLRWWRRHVGYVPQETTLIDASLRRNLVWSVPREVSDEECWAALDQCAAGFARRLPDGLDTRLGERGVRLSGGERQRVALARALLRRPSLLVLDEATSSLDEETEADIVDLIRTLTPAMTVLVIAHRSSTIASAHQVVRIQP